MYRVLIVEDDPQVARIHTGYLEQEGFQVVGVAPNAAEAQKLLKTDPVHLVLLDIYLPGSSGLDIFRELRIDGQAVEVIVVSAAKDSAQIREAFRMGCLDYIIKPFTYERLHNALLKYRKKMELLSKDVLGQEDIDLLATQQSSEEEAADLPKGIDRSTLYLMCEAILEQSGTFNVQDIVGKTGISRVSTKKYLDYLCESKLLRQTFVYGNKGRPANLYQVPAGKAAAIHQLIDNRC